MTHARRRRTVSRHAHLQSPSPLRRVLTWMLAGLCSITLAAAGVAAFIYQDFTTSVKDHAVDIGGSSSVTEQAQLSAYPDPFSMLVIGTDECDDSVKDIVGTARCNPEEAGNHLNDVNILIHVSAAPRRISVVSFPRDLRVDRPTCTNENGAVSSGTAKLNSAYDAGGLKCAVDTVSELTGMTIEFAAKLSFANVVQLTDAVGGVEVCVGGEGLYDPQYTGLALDPGKHTIQGGQALQFLRARHGLRMGSDLARISNQQQYMSRLIDKLRSDEVLTNPVRLLNLATIVSKNMQTDTQLADPMRMAQLALTIKDVPAEEIRFASYPVSDASDGSNDVIGIQSDADALIEAVKANQPFTFERTGDGVIEEEGTTPPPAEEAPQPDPNAPPATETPTAPEAVELGSATAGQTGAQKTCSNGASF